MDSPWLHIVSFFHIHTEWAASFVLAVVTWSPGAGDHSWPLYSAGMLHHLSAAQVLWWFLVSTAVPFMINTIE